jgi:uncharacterized protein (TIGR00290 family)
VTDRPAAAGAPAPENAGAGSLGAGATPAARAPRIKTLTSWSSGKDSAWALWVLQQRPDIELVGLLTSTNETVARVSMHAVRESVLEAQARACGLPLFKVPLPDPCTDEQYRERMSAAVADAVGAGVEAIAFGDLFLEAVRAYREEHLAGSGIAPLFPLWGLPTAELAREMLANGLEAIVTCVDTDQVEARFAGRTYDLSLLAELPEGVDPCAENGEFHTVAVAGPMFTGRLDVAVGERVDRGRFVFRDVALRGE